MTDIQIGRNLLMLMAKRNVRTVTELHQLTGVSRVTLSKVLNGKVDSISLSTIIRICQGLNCEVGELVKVQKVS